MNVCLLVYHLRVVEAIKPSTKSEEIPLLVNVRVRCIIQLPLGAIGVVSAIFFCVYL